MPKSEYKECRERREFKPMAGPPEEARGPFAGEEEPEAFIAPSRRFSDRVRVGGGSPKSEVLPDGNTGKSPGNILNDINLFSQSQKRPLPLPDDSVTESELEVEAPILKLLPMKEKKQVSL